MEVRNETKFGNTETFKLPSGYEVTIREQNGEDDDILSNPEEAKTLINISRFVAGIIIDTDYTSSRLMSADEVHMMMPVLDKYAIMFRSRIFSLGHILEFEFNWGTKEKPKTFAYEVDLNQFLFDYSKQDITPEYLSAKPDAIPYYPSGKNQSNLEFTLSTGKVIKYDLLTTAGDSYVLNLPPAERTKNKNLIARNICLHVSGKFEKILNFRMFTNREMAEIRSHIEGMDPMFTGQTTIVNPETQEEFEVSVLGINSFFYLRES